MSKVHFAALRKSSTTLIILIMALAWAISPGNAQAQSSLPAERDLAWLSKYFEENSPVRITDRTGDVFRGTVGIAGRNIPFLAYTSGRGGATSTGVEGVFAYLDLGELSFGHILPPVSGPALSGLREAKAPVLLAISESANRIIARELLPEAVRAWTDKVFGENAYQVQIEQGFNILTHLDIGKLPGMPLAFSTFNLGSTTRPVGAAVPLSYAKSLLRGASPAPGEAVRFWAPVPAPNLPLISSFMRFSDWAVSLSVEPTGLSEVAILGDMDADLGIAKLPFHGAIGVEADAIKLSGTYKEKVATGFAGINWLSVEDPTVLVAVSPEATRYSYGGIVNLGGRRFELTAGQVLSGGTPNPVFRFKADQPLAAADLVRIANAMINAESGAVQNPSTSGPIPVADLPQIEIQGEGGDPGPFFVYAPKGAQDPEIGVYSAGMLIRGRMVILGQTLARADARFDYLGGLQVDAQFKSPPALKIGPFSTANGLSRVDSADVSIVARLTQPPYASIVVKGPEATNTLGITATQAFLKTQISVLDGVFNGEADVVASLAGGQPVQVSVQAQQSGLDRFTVNLGAGLKFVASESKQAMQAATNKMHKYTEDLRQAEMGVLDAVRDADKVIEQAEAMIKRAEDAYRSMKDHADNVCNSIHWYDAAWKGPECAVEEAAAAVAYIAVEAAHAVADPIIRAAEKMIEAAVNNANKLIQAASDNLNAAVQDFEKVVAEGPHALAVAAAMSGLDLDKLGTLFKVNDATLTTAFPIGTGDASVTFDYTLLGRPGKATATFPLAAGFPDLKALATSGGPSGGSQGAQFDPKGKTFPPYLHDVATQLANQPPTGPLSSDDFKRLRDSEFCQQFPRASLDTLAYAEASRVEAATLLASSDRGDQIEGHYLNIAADALEKDVIVKNYGQAAALEWQDLVQAPLSVCDNGFSGATVQKIKNVHANAQLRVQDVQKLLNSSQPAVPITEPVTFVAYSGVPDFNKIQNTPRAWPNRPQTPCINADRFAAEACETAPSVRLQVKQFVNPNHPEAHRPRFLVQTTDGRCWQPVPPANWIDATTCTGSPQQTFYFSRGNIFQDMPNAPGCLTLDPASGRIHLVSDACTQPNQQFALVKNSPTDPNQRACNFLGPPPAGVSSFNGIPTAPLFRYYIRNADEHFYTRNWREVSSCNYEGIAANVFQFSDPAIAAAQGYQPLYRYYSRSAGAHYYSAVEREYLQANVPKDYQPEPIEGYVSAHYRPGLVPLYRYWRGIKVFLTTDYTERSNDTGQYHLDKIVGWVVGPTDLNVQPPQAALNCKVMNPPDNPPLPTAPRTGSAPLPQIVNGALAVPLYRYYTGGNTHFYTADWREIGACSYERHEGYVFARQVPGSVPLYRYYKPGANDHFYTTNLSELGPQGRDGYIAERIEGYVFQQQVPGTVRLFRYSLNGGHFYTTNFGELGGNGLEGEQIFVLAK